MKITPKLSIEQSHLLKQLVASMPAGGVSASARRQASLIQQAKHDVAARPPFAVEDRVELRRSVPETQYRAGQRGVIVALHGIPPRVAEVEIDGTYYSDVVSLKDLKTLA